MCNEYIAAANRVCNEVPTVTPLGEYWLKRSFRRIRRRLGHVEPMSEEQFVDTYSGKKKTRYENAVQSLRDKGFHRGDRWVSAFVKAEKFNPDAKKNPDPRMIQSRNARYNVTVGVHLKAMEKRLYDMRGSDGLRIVAKGLNSLQRAKLYKRKWDLYDDPVGVCLDCSRWDGHCDVKLLEQEHAVYLSMNPDPVLKQALAWQLLNKCRTAKGNIVYTVRGKRMSGDMNTALGNCLGMIGCMGAAMEYLGVDKYSLLDDGDDCRVIVERADYNKLRGLPFFFLELGHELKVEDVRDTYVGTIFCQSRLIEGPRGVQFVRDWKKVLSQDCAGSHHWTDPRVAPDMMTAIGVSCMAEAAGLPVLQAFASRVTELSSGVMPKCSITEEEVLARYRRELKGWNGPVRPLPITLAARLSFWEAFGVDLDSQRHIEDQIQCWTPLVDVYDDIGPERTAEWRDLTPPDLIPSIVC